MSYVKKYPIHVLDPDTAQTCYYEKRLMCCALPSRWEMATPISKITLSTYAKLYLKHF